jgi:hypothetical protein
MLLNRGCSLDTIPSPLDADRTMTTPRNTVTLQSPWYDPVSQQTFSVGTRFVKANEQLSSDNGMVSVMILDPQQFIFMPTEIPKKVCAPHYFANNQEKIAHFVALIRHWATAYNGFIPYVFGGCSFTNTAHAPFTARHVDKETKIYEIADTQTPKTGMDCAGLVARAAQVCDIPYFLKNTATLARHLHAVQHDGFSEGDLIWIPGHVMVISDIKNNLLVEARGYDHGYGKVQEIELKKVFKDIATYDDLHYAHMQKIPLRRMDKQGTIRETFPEWKVLKLSSVWLE